jgi:hypothetical protein
MEGVNFAVVGAMINQYNINSNIVVVKGERSGNGLETIIINQVLGCKYKTKGFKKTRGFKKKGS